MNGYRMGVVYVWNKVPGWSSVLEGTECMVTGPAMKHPKTGKIGWPTDTPDPLFPFNCVIVAEPGNLREKNPPQGEQSIMEMFNAPAPREMEPA